MEILNMSLSATTLIIAIVIIRALALHRLSKSTFFALWAVALCRLLIPFSVPSRFSIYTLVNMLKTRLSAANTTVTDIAPINIGTAAGTINTTLAEAASVSISPVMLIWLVGLLVSVLFFLVTHLRCRMEYKTALPLDNEFIRAWQQYHPTKRKMEIRQSDRIATPMTYGIFQPVILLPKETDWTNETRLRYILSHEFVHIRRFDTLTKLLLAAVLCVHWFNPLVWMMYVLANRDIELSCDEAVIRTFGETIKSAYALTLIGLADKKNHLTPLVNNFSKNAIEERIVSIMKIKKTSLIGMILALTLVIGTTIVFATNAAAAGNDKDVIVGAYSNNTAAAEDVIVGAYSNNTPISAQEQAKLDQQKKEEISKQYAVYEKYGLTYDQKTDSFYYNGKLVRFFADKLDAESNYYISFTRANGVIDLRTARNSNNELTGISPASQEEYDKRTESNKRAQTETANIKGASENATANSTSGSTSAVEAEGADNTVNNATTAFYAGDPNYVDNSLNAYLDYGISYDKANKQWIFNNKPIHYLSDGDNATYLDNSTNAIKNGVSLEVVRKANGQIDKLVEISD